MVGKNIPTVAEVSQGEVVKFASDACKVMGEGGVSVLLEGREQTVSLCFETPNLVQKTHASDSQPHVNFGGTESFDQSPPAF